MNARSLKDKILEITEGPRTKKYTALVEDKETKKTRKISFGARDYEQYKDSTPLKLYKNKDHGDAERRRNYFSRHSGVDNKQQAVAKELRQSGGRLNAKILSHFYLW